MYHAARLRPIRLIGPIHLPIYAPRSGLRRNRTRKRRGERPTLSRLVECFFLHDTICHPKGKRELDRPAVGNVSVIVGYFIFRSTSRARGRCDIDNGASAP
jgi:hypothetical protein